MRIDFQKPPPQARTLEEAQSLINELWPLLRELSNRIDVLEERLATNSRNSSTPPSTDPHRSPAKKAPSGKKPGAQVNKRPPRSGSAGCRGGFFFSR